MMSRKLMDILGPNRVFSEVATLERLPRLHYCTSSLEHRSHSTSPSSSSLSPFLLQMLDDLLLDDLILSLKSLSNLLIVLSDRTPHLSELCHDIRMTKL